ncbi:helix-turn-helix domain-containing protein [Haladaptatus caseinilyticus]|uniref:helix-turn-helix domain-containing protein n=1 Tax=Haladaptatus caseinilyticus TaxID=2993314 RepID=UPI00224B0ADB|nr:bacterio-opsin activator domain-containing protein [Haladaptatus caseinilyticus]
MEVVTVEFTVPSECFILGEILTDGSDVSIELTQFVPVEQTLVPYFWAETTDQDAFEQSVRADERVATLTPLDAGPEKTLYQIEWTRDIDHMLTAFREHNLIVEEATGTADTWHFTVRGPNRGNLSSFQQACADYDIPLEIQRVWNPGKPATAQYDITEKQREAIEYAFTDGYFNVPRETSLGVLGEAMGITGQSFARRLRRGLYSLVKHTVMDNQK